MEPAEAPVPLGGSSPSCRVGPMPSAICAAYHGYAVVTYTNSVSVYRNNGVLRRLQRASVMRYD